MFSHAGRQQIHESIEIQRSQRERCEGVPWSLKGRGCITLQRRGHVWPLSWTAELRARHARSLFCAHGPSFHGQSQSDNTEHVCLTASYLKHRSKIHLILQRDTSSRRNIAYYRTRCHQRSTECHK